MPPFISVLIASYRASRTIGVTLGSLAAQRGGPAMEVIVIDSSEDDATARVAREYPAVRLLRVAGRRYAGEARNVGAAEARGDILALLDADCLVGPEWSRHVARAHARADGVIGGVVENANPESYPGWAYYFTEFSQWLPGVSGGPVAEVPGCSMTLKRQVFDRYGPFMPGGYCSDTEFTWRLARDGVRPYLDPTIRVRHVNPSQLRAIFTHVPHHGRAFARVRCRAQAAPAGATLLRALAAPLLPPLLFARSVRRVLRSPGCRRRFALAAPLTLAAMMAWSGGELAGYLESSWGRRTS